MTPSLVALLSVPVAGVLSAFVTRHLVGVLRARKILALPNARSSHKLPIPTGGGWAVLGVTLVCWLLLSSNLDAPSTAFLSATLGLAFISWFDDLRTLSAALRLFVQALAVALCLAQISPDTRILWHELPFWVDRVVVGFGWLWFVNLFNFMDGIDGIAGVETITICLGFFVLQQINSPATDLVYLSGILTGATAGFLIWNWHPAKIILGDVGAVPLGFMTGWLLINLALQGQLAAALILPLYFATDATITLLMRLYRRERFWLPHMQHFYQKPILAGYTHAQVVLRIIPANILLLGTAILSLYVPLLSIALAVIIVALLLWHLHTMSTR